MCNFFQFISKPVNITVAHIQQLSHKLLLLQDKQILTITTYSYTAPQKILSVNTRLCKTVRREYKKTFSYSFIEVTVSTRHKDLFIRQ